MILHLNTVEIVENLSKTFISTPVFHSEDVGGKRIINNVMRKWSVFIAQETITESITKGNYSTNMGHGNAKNEIAWKDMLEVPARL